MAKISYHRHYLPQEAIRKLETYYVLRGKNKEKARQNLLGAAASTIGQYNKVTGYEGENDFNPDYLHFLSEEAYLQKKNRTVLRVDEAIGALIAYNNFRDRDKRKATKALITAGVAILNEYNRLEGYGS